MYISKIIRRYLTRYLNIILGRANKFYIWASPAHKLSLLQYLTFTLKRKHRWKPVNTCSTISPVCTPYSDRAVTIACLVTTTRLRRESTHLHETRYWECSSLYALTTAVVLKTDSLRGTGDYNSSIFFFTSRILNVEAGASRLRNFKSNWMNFCQEIFYGWCLI